MERVLVWWVAGEWGLNRCLYARKTSQPLGTKAPNTLLLTTYYLAKRHKERAGEMKTEGTRNGSDSAQNVSTCGGG